MRAFLIKLILTRLYGLIGQRFVRHIASESKSDLSSVFPGFLARDTGIGKATSGLAGVRVLKLAPSSSSSYESQWKHQGEFTFFFVLAGSIRLHTKETAHLLEASDSGTCHVHHALEQSNSLV